MAFGEGKNRRQTTVGKGALGQGMRIATGAERPRNDRSRKNLRVIPRPVRRLVVGSEPSAASGRGSEVSEWPRSKFPAPAVRQRRNFGHRNRAIRNTPAQRSRRTDCHSQCAHWLRNDTFSRSAVGFFMVRRGGALPLPRAGKSAKRCRWQRKRAGFEEMPRLAATTVAGNRLARRWAREPRPYGSVTGGAVGRRPQGLPLRSAAMNVWAGYRPLRKFFDREGMVCFGFWWRRMTRAPGC